MHCPSSEPERVEENLFFYFYFSFPLSIQAGRNRNAEAVRRQPAEVSEKVHELLLSPQQVCVQNLSMTVHSDEPFVKTNGKYTSMLSLLSRGEVRMF